MRRDEFPIVHEYAKDQVNKVLEEIKAEITEKISHYEHFSSSNTAHGLEMALDIVNKHMSGKEKE